MGILTPEVPRPELTPAQAAETIQNLFRIENREALERNWRRQVPLGRVALHALRSTGDLELDAWLHLPLTPQEMGSGLKHIEKEQHESIAPPAAVRQWPVQPTAEQWRRIDILADTSGYTLDKAYSTVMGIWSN